MTEEFRNMNAGERNKYLRDLLKEDCTITFTKVDGSTREMPCTLRTEAMPQQAKIQHHSTKPYNPEVLSVWCLDKQEWRSFRVMNVTEVRKLVND